MSERQDRNNIHPNDVPTNGKEDHVTDRLLILLGQLPDELLEEAVCYEAEGACSLEKESNGKRLYEDEAKKGKFHIVWKKSSLLAACFCAVFLGGLVWYSNYELEHKETPTQPMTHGGTAAGAGNQTQGTAETGGFWYKESYYSQDMQKDPITALPEQAVYMGTLHYVQQEIEQTGQDWQTNRQALADCPIYQVENQEVMLLEWEGRYWYCTKDE